MAEVKDDYYSVQAIRTDLFTLDMQVVNLMHFVRQLHDQLEAQGVLVTKLKAQIEELNKGATT